MRPIDADALIDRMYHDAFETDTDMQKWDSGCWIRYKMFENAIDDAPTIEPKAKVVAQVTFDEEKMREIVKEAVERFKEEYEIEPKRGEWKRRIVDNGFNADWVCSECGYRVKNDFVDYNFCPNCGADMRKESE